MSDPNLQLNLIYKIIRLNLFLIYFDSI
jgi:hypothetical protein